jgi:O-antigen/teichoic acid export membrane protein
MSRCAIALLMRPDGPLSIQGSPPARWRFARVTASMTLVNVVIMAAAFVTAPLQARALGPSGRGDLAAILVPFGLAPLILHLGIGAYGARQAARGKPLGPLLGSLGSATLVIGVLGALAGVPLAAYLAEGRDTVHTYLLVAFALLPVGLVGTLLISVNSGLERWNVVIAARLIPPLSGVIALAALYLLDALTVESAAIVAIAGGVASTIPLFGILRGRKLSFDPPVIREGIPFGLKAWLGGLASLSNTRVDQLLMITLVSPRQLGLYAVAVSLAGFSGALTAGLGPPLFTRVAAGETELAARALRVSLVLAGIATIIVALLTPPLIYVLFGSPFEDSIPMAWILLAAGIPLAGATVLTAALTATGRPGVPAVAEAVALVVTIAGLAVLLPPFAGIGAAIVSLVAYLANFVIQFRSARREFGGRARDFLLVGRADFKWAWELTRTSMRQARLMTGRSR